MGGGRCFTAGIDLQDHASLFLGGDDMPSDGGRKGVVLFEFIRYLQSCLTSVEAIRQPVIAAVHGLCIGAGVDMITACDIRVCSADAVFSVREVDVGLAADVGTLQRLPRVVGNDSLVRDWCLTGRNVDAAEALRAGLVSTVCDDAAAVRAHALRLAATIASKSPIAVYATKRALVFARDHTVDDGLQQIATLNTSMLQSADVATAVTAAMSKQKPVFAKL
jgi:enoyl-CoA hydratase/carnithine racemase